uniref:Uncharacterized protein n=1 Tax=Cacopsylla melanoneura TaxID=428564 RepID=A0A8D8QUH6_9HEMI
MLSASSSPSWIGVVGRWLSVGFVPVCGAGLSATPVWGVTGSMSRGVISNTRNSFKLARHDVRGVRPGVGGGVPKLDSLSWRRAGASGVTGGARFTCVRGVRGYSTIGVRGVIGGPLRSSVGEKDPHAECGATVT